MDDEKYPVYKEKFSVRLLHYIQDIWPSIYRVVNSFIFGAIEFFPTFALNIFNSASYR